VEVAQVVLHLHQEALPHPEVHPLPLVVLPLPLVVLPLPQTVLLLLKQRLMRLQPHQEEQVKETKVLLEIAIIVKTHTVVLNLLGLLLQ